MPVITELINRYFVQSIDIEIPGEQLPATSKGNQVDYFIDGDQYFGALHKEVEKLLKGSGPSYFYLADWILGLVKMPTELVTGHGSLPTVSAYKAGPESDYFVPLPAFKLDDGSGAVLAEMIDQLEALAQKRVDVRALLWVSPLVLEFDKVAQQVDWAWRVNVHSVLSAQALRSRTNMHNKVMLQTLAHPLGAMHLKMVVCGDGDGMRAYVGGMDLTATRGDGWKHEHDHGYYFDVWTKKGKAIGWHDVAVRVQGPAAEAVYNYYRLIWDEELQNSAQTFRIEGKDIPSYIPEITPAVPVRKAPASLSAGTQHVQVLRTAPQMNFAFGSTKLVDKGCIERLITGFRHDPLSFAEDGIFELRAALRKAIAHAETYIYMEDQSFASTEIMDWIKDRMNVNHDLVVIMLHGGDPADPPSGFLPEAINKHLVPHLMPRVDEPSHRIAFCEYTGVTVHSKLIIIDDLWAAIGTANAMRRSLYTDEECSISVLDEAVPTFAQRLRKDLWGEHCGIEPGPLRDPLLELEKALGVWNADWGTPPSGFHLKKAIKRMQVPFVVGPDVDKGEWPLLPPYDKLQADLGDADSREEF